MRNTGTVSFINAKSNSAVSHDSIVAACLSAAVLKAVADSFNTELTDNRMRGDAVNRMSPFPGMVGTESSVTYKFTVAHFYSPYFLIYRVTGLKPF